MTEMRKFDCVVIGSGLAGFSAALHLKNRNKSVCVLSTGPGATAVSSGCWDFGPIGSDDKAPYSALASSDGWKSLYQQLYPGNNPILGAEETCREIARALGPDLKLVSAFEKAVALPTSAGEWKKTFVAQGIHGAGSLDSLRGKKCLLLGAPQWRFQAKQVGEMLLHNAKKLGVEISLVTKEAELGTEGTDFPLPHIATRLAADPKFLQSFIDWAVRNSRTQDASVVLFPPVFPSQKIFEQVQTKVGVSVAELLCSVEPTAGYRLHVALSNALLRHSIATMPVLSIDKFDAAEGELRALECTSRAHEKERVEASQFILCSGKFFGGGIQLGYTKVRETILGLPLFLPNQSPRIHLRSETELKESPFHSPQGWSSMGVKVNSSWQPLDEAGMPVFKNLRACGSIVGGVDFAYSQVGLGFMACSGREAALVLS